MKRNVKYVQDRNKELKDDYEKTLLRLSEIQKELETREKDEKEQYFVLLEKLLRFYLKLTELEKEMDDSYFTSKSMEELKDINLSLYNDILPDNYNRSYANPTFCVKKFGSEMGQMLSYFYNAFRSTIHHAYSHQIYMLHDFNKLFIETYEFIQNNEVTYKGLHKIATRRFRRNRVPDFIIYFNEAYNPEYQFFTEVLDKDDLTDLRYLFKTGKYITENEIKLAQFLASYPASKLKQLGKAIVDAYVKSFEVDGKELGDRTNVTFRYDVGLERIIKQVALEMKNVNLFPVVLNVYSTNANKQVAFDHRFDHALVVDEEYGEKIVKDYREALETTKEILDKASGIIAVESFGRKLFSPENKPEILEMAPEQKTINQTYRRKMAQARNEFLKRDEMSFSIIAFPVPDIGEKFEEIFDKIVEVNMADSEIFEKYQQVMIDVLDRADYVQIKGVEGNKTDLKIKLQKIKNPDAETLFYNCGADSNIPAGEIFTSPQLEGTNGVLHVEESYQSALLYKNLTLEFKDGYVSEYTCSNFDTEEENKKYIKQNLLFPHDTLPMGEFAIGTNTLAYVIARKYKILDVLPILISEKTAPHFAIGDTCYSMSEDVKILNRFNNKQIIACDNEKSILRKTDRKDEAYTFKHSDIVMPFDVIDSITAVLYNGEKIDLIRTGKFVLEGTEDLNEPLIEFEQMK